MRRVIAAVTDDGAAGSVLRTACAVGRLFGAEVEALHAGMPHPALRERARELGVPLRDVAEEPLRALDAAAAHDNVVALVIGARGQRGGRRPAGSTALSVITHERRPVVVVPPDGPSRQVIASILVPLDGTPDSAATLADVIELAHGAALRIVVAHVQRPDELPAFSDHTAHEVTAWCEEFVARHCPAASEATLELRVGEADRHVLDILRESGCDLIALSWHQDLSRGRAAVVRSALAASPIPILLTPALGGQSRGRARAMTVSGGG